MAYVRRGVNCELVPQPAHTTATDAYGNTFENWCADYQGCDVENTIVKTGCDPQDPDGLIPLWTARYVDNTPRIVSPYQKNVIRSVTFITPGDEMILVAEQDRDLQFYNEGNTFQLQLEDNTIVESVLTTTMLISETGNTVITEDGKQYEIIDGVVVGLIPTD